ncbi:uncharacterized protein LACBIDRAFT_302656 [Laccaria bicolor S238N-H82]|uniref:Predicted protein n=1 Tax=Laccaria bicolor (strain S238N-H82 / ATCC MYA-4686) TaxID=486041 RepID=B0DI37_LACBS|nr:uncharacterized protein LACBIDRAFT_302656 [Laccaria bicolor S238N-H82]EDR05841.1 predicted protein [Laccaria bicolor S238N-H82]|eukprot:XP_001883517.1 predicted protein [Laccaria bicolor S238N-H82]
MNVNHFLGPMGVNGALTEEGRAQLEGIIAHHQQIVVEIEAEAAIALEALKTLTKQRNEAHAWLASLSTTVDKGSLPQVIKHEEALLGDIDERMMNVEGELHCLGGLEDEDVTYSDNYPQPEPSDDVKRDIEQNRRELRQLSDDYQNISKQLALHRDQLSPIRKVPPEIIRLIFLFWDVDRPRRRTATYVSPNVLTGVCIAWKNIALGTPELWASISVEIQKGVCYPDKRVVEAWLEHSGSCPLSISIEERDPFLRSSRAGIDYTLPTILTTEPDSEDPIDSVVSSMFEVFIPHHARWQKVRIRYKDAWSEKTGFASLPKDTSFPLLEELYLEKSYWLEQDDVDRITSTMLSAPRLHSVSWLSQKPFTTLTFPWAQLTHFWLGHIISMTEGLRIITSCPQLTSLELTLILPVQDTFTNGSDPIVHNNLQRLHLSTAGDLGILFDKLTLPALNDLSLSEVHGSFPNITPVHIIHWPQSQFLAFLLRSVCTVKHFIIQECDISAEEMLECLAHPQISTWLDSLSITEDHQKHLCVTEEVLRRLTHTTFAEKVLHSGDNVPAEETNTETLCPNLSTIKLWGCISAQDGRVADMVESRWLSAEDCPVKQLKMAVIGFFANACHTEDCARLQALNRRRFGITYLRL